MTETPLAASVPLDEDYLTPQLTDDNQYEHFYPELEDLPESDPERSFPIAAESKEAKHFDEAESQIVEYLEKNNMPWESISCLGRPSRSPDGERKSHSTVVIGAAAIPEGLRISDIVRGIQEATGLELPIEFVKGTTELESYFG
jgi:hypothetical protein